MNRLFLLLEKWFLPLFLTTAIVALAAGAGIGLYKAKQNKVKQTPVFLPPAVVVSPVPTSSRDFNPPVSESPTSPTPPTRQETGKIKIIDGNVCLVGVDGRVKILVDKIRWQSVPIDYFSDVSISPDGTKMCFLAHATQPIWLFWSKIDGSNATNVNTLAKNCVWSHNSQKIAFNNQTSDVSSVDIYVYDTQTDNVKNLTESVNQSQTFIRLYKQPEWADGDTKIIGKYTAFPINDPTNQSEGLSSINLATYEIEDR